jgi:hypothetical protein
MDDIRHIFNIIDKNSNTIPEGDYIEVCNKLKGVYNHILSDTTPTLFDMNQYQVQPVNVDENSAYFLMQEFFDQTRNFEIDFIEAQIRRLNDMLTWVQPIYRIGKEIKKLAIRHFCVINVIEEYEGSLTLQPLLEYCRELNRFGDQYIKREIRRLCKVYKDIENRYRIMCRTVIEQRLSQLMHKLQELEYMSYPEF